MFYASERGAPQGGPLSPLLLNIALHGMETFLSQYQKVRVRHPTSQAKRQRQVQVKSPQYGYLRYADDIKSGDITII